jgi:hypothetical protein
MKTFFFNTGEKINYNNKMNNNLLIEKTTFIHLFDPKLVDYIKNTIYNGNYVTCLKKLYSDNIFTKEEFVKKYSVDGKLKIWKSNRFGWPDEHVKYFKGNYFRNKKRPEHSELMKIKMLGIDRGDVFREIKRKQNSGINFKRKFLINRGFNIDDLTDEKIIERYSQYLKDRNNSFEYKKNKICNFINKNKKYLNESIYVDFVTKNKDVVITETNVDNLYKEVFSIISTITIKNSETMGNTKYFKRGIIVANYCLNKDIIRYRSSWELKTIQFLEENLINYEYEPFYIKKDDGTLYLPDFLLYLNNKVLLEIKGYIRGKKGKEKEKMKIDAGEKYCKENNLKWVYLTKPLTNLNYLDI